MDKVTFTLTTCHRPDLLNDTLLSFQDNCVDKESIKRYICSDDHSHKLEVSEMRRRYPYLEIYPSEKKGQHNSLKNLFDHVDTEWIFHCEDDWRFTRKFSIKEMLLIAMSDPRIKNVGLRYWDGILVKDGDIRFRQHFFSRKFDYEHAKITDCHWYGFSYNPGIIHMPTIRNLGFCTEIGTDDRYWDRIQALKYYEMGFKKANVVPGAVEHTGHGRSLYTVA